MPKNVTIYLSDEIAGKMEKYQEVNWSEICRTAVTDYIDTRSHIDIAPILEKLKAEKNQAYKQGQIFFYEQIAPKMVLADFESWYPEVSKRVLQDRQSQPFFDVERLSEAAAEVEAPKAMRLFLQRFCSLHKIQDPPSDAPLTYFDGAIYAFMGIYSALKGKKE